MCQRYLTPRMSRKAQSIRGIDFHRQTSARPFVPLVTGGMAVGYLVEHQAFRAILNSTERCGDIVSGSFSWNTSWYESSNDCNFAYRGLFVLLIGKLWYDKFLLSLIASDPVQTRQMNKNRRDNWILWSVTILEWHVMGAPIDGEIMYSKSRFT